MKDVGPAGRDYPSMPQDASHDIAADAAGKPEGRGPVVRVIRAAQRPHGRAVRAGVGGVSIDNDVIKDLQ
jgi:hypothetical protein